MKAQPIPPIDLDTRAWRHLTQTLIALLPPPIQDPPEAIETRNHAAIARIAAMAPVNANEAELAAESVLARAQAQEVMRLIRLHDGDIKRVIRLNAQYLAMVKLALAVNARLVREQQQRRKRETIHRDADQDEWTRHIAAQSMLDSLPEEPKTEPESQTVGNETPTGQSPSPITPNSPLPTPAPRTQSPPTGT